MSDEIDYIDSEGYRHHFSKPVNCTDSGFSSMPYTQQAQGITPEPERSAGYYPSKQSTGIPQNPACVYDTPVPAQRIQITDKDLIEMLYNQVLFQKRIVRGLSESVTTLLEEKQMLSNPQQKLQSTYYYLLKCATDELDNLQGSKLPDHISQALSILCGASKDMLTECDKQAYKKWFGKRSVINSRL